MLESLIERAGLNPRELLREKGTPYAELGLGDDSLSDAALMDAMMEHPILINRPLVVEYRRFSSIASMAAKAGPFAYFHTGRG